MIRLKSSTIELNDVRLYAFHGVLEQERRVGGEYSVSLRVHYNIGKAMESDHVDDTLNYALLLDIIKEENLVDNAARVGDYLLSELRKIDKIKEVRGRGLMIGIEFEQPIKEIRNDRLLMQQHVFTGVAGANTIRLLPPLCLSMAEAQDFIERFKKCL